MFTLAAALGRDCYVQQTRVDWVDQQSPEWAAEGSKLRLEFDPWWRGEHKPPTGRPPWTFEIPADCTRINIRSHGMEDEGAHALAKALKACVACAVEELPDARRRIVPSAHADCSSRRDGAPAAGDPPSAARGASNALADSNLKSGDRRIWAIHTSHSQLEARTRPRHIARFAKTSSPR